MSAGAPGPRNAITDVAGLVVGNAQDDRIKTGVTVLTADRPFVAGVHILGGAPGTRETDLLAPDRFVQEVDALVLSGGSAFGLAAADGVVDALRQRGRGTEVAGQRVPIVPAAILFDLANGGDKGWTDNPYPALGHAALNAAAESFETGSHGAGTGATVAGLKGGLGTASIRLPSEHMVGALVAVNAFGTVNIDDGPHFWAAPFEIGDEFGGRGPGMPATSDMPATKNIAPRQATTIAIVATDATLTQAQATRMAAAAHAGLARAVVPSHTLFDGDLVFAAATGTAPAPDPVEQVALGHAAASTLSRAIARGVQAATAAPGDPFPTWQDRFGRD